MSSPINSLAICSYAFLREQCDAVAALFALLQRGRPVSMDLPHRDHAERSDKDEKPFPIRPTAMMRRLLCVAFFFVASAPAFADPLGFGFRCITANAAGSCGIGEAQITGTVTAGVHPGDVLFTFTNAGPLQSSVAEIYFDTTLSLLNAAVINGAGVNFCIDGQPCGTIGKSKNTAYSTTPGNLPGGNTISFSADYSAGAVNPEPTNGINPGEQLGIAFHLAGGSLDTVILALQQDTFRIGAHVVSFAYNNPSAAFVDQLPLSPPVVPEPATLLLLGGGICSLGAFRRRRSSGGRPPETPCVSEDRKEGSRQPDYRVHRSTPLGASISAPMRI